MQDWKKLSGQFLRFRVIWYAAYGILTTHDFKVGKNKKVGVELF